MMMTMSSVIDIFWLYRQIDN